MRVSDEDVEAAAQELCRIDEQDGGPPWNWYPETGKHGRMSKEAYRERARAALSAVPRWRLWSEMPEPQVGDKVWAYSHAEGVNVLEYDHPIHEDFDGPDEEEPPLWWMDGEDVSGPEWKFTHWMPYRVPEPPTDV
jgi:hypothetical protein